MAILLGRGMINAVSAITAVSFFLQQHAEQHAVKKVGWFHKQAGMQID